MPAGSSARSFKRSACWPSRGSPTKRYAFASAAGPMNSGSTSIDRQSETQAPHWMHAIVCVTSIIDSGGTTYSRSGGSPSGSSQGVTRWIFVQWTASMSTIRSLSTGMLPIGSTTMAPFGAVSAALSRCVWHASVGLPLMRTPHEPQIAARQEQRIPIEPSSRSRACRIPSSTERCPSRSIVKSSQWAASPDSGEYRRILSVYSGISVCPLLGLPLCQRHRRVGHLGRTAAVDGQGDVLEPFGVVALGEVQTELGTARLLALQRADDDALGRIQHVPELDGSQHILVEDRAAVVDAGDLGLLLQAPDDLVGLGQPLVRAEHGALLVHHRAEVVLDLGDPAAAGVVAPQDRVDLPLLVGERAVADARHRHPER